MRVGIMSMQRVKNYGSFMQAYGLRKLIEELGHEVIFVDYKVEDSLETRGTVKTMALYKALRFVWRSLKKGYKRLNSSNLMGKDLAIKNFMDSFAKEYFIELGLSEQKKYRCKVDVLVIGSDEVFNCTQKGEEVGYSKELFGAGNNADKLLSYAASFGNTTLSKLQKYRIKDEISELLKKFQTISVRDQNSYSIVENLTGRKPEIHFDPALIFDFTNDIRDTVSETNYVVLYAYSGRITDEEGLEIRRFADAKGMKIISIGGYQSCCNRYVYGHPLEILAYFKHADYIITDTFHGTIFSVINHRPFVTLIRTDKQGNGYGNEEKLSFLLKELKLEDRALRNICDLWGVLESDINYSITDEIIEKNRKRTEEYLKGELGQGGK